MISFILGFIVGGIVAWIVPAPAVVQNAIDKVLSKFK